MKRAIIVHGWSGSPKHGWKPWLKTELESAGFEVKIPFMPDPDYPKINLWVAYLEKLIPNPDKDTFLIGHSIGCQTVLRFLDKQPKETKVAGVILVAPWTKLTEEALEEEGSKEIAQPWINTPIDWQNVKEKSQNFTAIFSDNDPYVTLSQSDIFKEKLEAKIIIEKNKGHFSGEDGVNTLPSVLQCVLDINS